MSAATTLVVVDVDSLALKLSPVRGEADHAAAHAELADRTAIYTTAEGERLIGILELPTRFSSGYMVVRFADGKWGRADNMIELAEDTLDAVDAEITAHEAGHDLDPETCQTCHVLFTRRANAHDL